MGKLKVQVMRLIFVFCAAFQVGYIRSIRQEILRAVGFQCFQPGVIVGVIDVQLRFFGDLVVIVDPGLECCRDPASLVIAEIPVPVVVFFIEKIPGSQSVFVHVAPLQAGFHGIGTQRKDRDFLCFIEFIGQEFPFIKGFPVRGPGIGSPRYIPEIALFSFVLEP